MSEGKKFEDYFKLVKHKLPYWDELPEIDLYMDQVIALMEKYLSFHKTNDNDTIITFDAGSLNTELVFDELKSNTTYAVKVFGDYYDDDEVGYDYETMDMLKKYTNKTWHCDEMRGYNQGDWNLIYYVKDEVSQEQLEEIENFYMGKVSEFTVVEEEDDPDSVYHT